MKKCPYCAEEIQDEAIICRYCGKSLTYESIQSQHPLPGKKTKLKSFTTIILVLIVIFVVAWILVRPGVFTIQPIRTLPDGVTIIYYSRSSEMPFFSSPDGICLEMQGGVSLLCRGMALASASNLTDRIIIKLPYIREAYLLSTDGQEFDR